MDVLDDMGASKLSAKVFFFEKWTTPLMLSVKDFLDELANQSYKTVTEVLWTSSS